LDDATAAESLARGFRETADPSAQLRICLHGSDRLARVRDAIERDERDPIMKKFKDIHIAVIVALAEEYRIFRTYFHGEYRRKISRRRSHD
jgi:hypothetical protein